MHAALAWQPLAGKVPFVPPGPICNRLQFVFFHMVGSFLCFFVAVAALTWQPLAGKVHFVPPGRDRIRFYLFASNFAGCFEGFNLVGCLRQCLLVHACVSSFAGRLEGFILLGCLRQ